MGGGGIQSLGPTLQPRGGGSLAPPLQESVYSLVEEFSAMSLSTLGEEETVDTRSVSSADQVTSGTLLLSLLGTHTVQLALMLFDGEITA